MAEEDLKPDGKKEGALYGDKPLVTLTSDMLGLVGGGVKEIDRDLTTNSGDFLKAALIREIWEEAGLTIKADDIMSANIDEIEVLQSRNGEGLFAFICHAYEYVLNDEEFIVMNDFILKQNRRLYLKSLLDLLNPDNKINLRPFVALVVIALQEQAQKAINV
jgi:8-oxo-dGTP pyrophosphatase MutT (NUDIX family)